MAALYFYAPFQSSTQVYFLFYLSRIIDKNGGKSPLTYKQFQNILASMEPPPAPEPTITLEDFGNCYTPISEDHDDKYGVPTLEELGTFFKNHLNNLFLLC